MTEKRHQWASNLGFILAALTSAISICLLYTSDAADE